MPTLAGLDLEQVLGFEVSPCTAAGVLALDGRLDRLEAGWRRNGWSLGSGLRVVASDAYAWGVLGRVLSYRAAADDLFELSVDVWRQEESPLVVQATVVVGCFCRPDHEIHTVADREWAAAGGVELGDALADAMTTLEAWVALDLDPDGWRARAGLPTRAGPPAHAAPVDQR